MSLHFGIFHRIDCLLCQFLDQWSNYISNFVRQTQTEGFSLSVMNFDLRMC